MTREEAKTWLSIPREKLAVIAHKINKHFDVIYAYANGAEIQFKYRNEGDWKTLDSPAFDGDIWTEYRVKPSEAQTAEQWKPKKGEKVFYVSAFGEVKQLEIDNSIASNIIVDFGNCFRTREEAEAARERASAALKGETHAATEKLVESLKGVPLTDDERTLLCCFRNASDRGIFAIEKAFMFESVRESGLELIVPDEQVQRELYMAIKSFTKEATK